MDFMWILFVIVMTAWKEPHLGYTEGLHGVNGWSLASGHGLLR